MEDRIKYLESERELIWNRLVAIESRIAPETESEANGASRKAAEYRNRAKQCLDDAISHKTSIEHLLSAQSDAVEASRGNLTEVSDLLNVAKEELSKVKTAVDQSESIVKRISELEDKSELAAQNLSTSIDSLKKVESTLASSVEYQKKIELLFKRSTEYYEKIDVLDTEIFGYFDEEKKEDVLGLKGKLDDVYASLQKDANDLKGALGQTEKSAIDRFEQFEFHWEGRLASLAKKIETLLPNALTAGLSHAYEEKRKRESQDASTYESTFQASVYALVAISLVPFAFSAWSIFRGLSVEESLIRVPRLVLAILPLYVPVLWVAYSANRRMNLSKRLVEEYSHKEVLAKTFEGLVKQIEDLDGDEADELRTKLLYNILDVSAENPGKLISDYNKTDHPLLDALDKSVKLTNAVERLARIPGFSKLAQRMQSKADKILETESRKADSGLNGT